MAAASHSTDRALKVKDLPEETLVPANQVAPDPPAPAPEPAKKAQRLQISIPLSAEATASVRSKAAVYRGQVTQEAFVRMIGEELGVESRLPEALRTIIDRLEKERRVRLGLEGAPVEHAGGEVAG